MILKSFYRKKSTRIYLTILISVMCALFTINIAIEQLNKQTEDYLKEVSLIFIQSQQEIINELKNYKSIGNVKKVLLFEYIDKIIEKDYLAIYELDSKILVYPSKKLTRGEAILGFNDIDFKIQKEKSEEYINKTQKFRMGDKVIPLTIKGIENCKRRSKLIISEELFEELYNSSDSDNYVANTNPKQTEEIIVNELSNKLGISIISLTEETKSEMEGISKIQQYIEILNIANYIIIFVLIVLIIIINKNIISDMKSDINLEYKLGFKNYQIKLSVLKVLGSLHLLSFGISFCIIITLILLLNIYFKIEMNLLALKNVLILIFMILVSDLLLILIVSNKSNKKKGENFMKKMFSLVLCAFLCCMTLSNVDAKSLRDVYLIPKTQSQFIVKYDTEGMFHTSVLATSINLPAISVENTVQRQDSNGNWVNRGRSLPYVKVLNVGYESNYNLGGVADTRSIWANVTPGSTLIGNFYINNGYA